MASKLKTFDIKSMVGGLNVYSNATQTEDNESPDMINCDFVGLTAVTKRRGYIPLISQIGSNPIQGMFTYITDTVREILYASAGNLYRYDGAGGSTLISSSVFSGTANVNGAQVGDRLYFADGVSGLQYYNGTTVTTAGIADAPSAPSELITYNDRLYCNSSDNRDRVYYGQPLTSTGDSTNTGVFTTGADSGFFLYGLGREVTTFKKIGTSGQSSLYVFLEDGIERATPTVVSTNTVHTNVTVSSSIGCRSPRSVQNVENDILFLDSTVYSLGEVGTFASLRTRNISAKVQKLFQGMVQSAVKDAAGVYYEKEQVYLLAIRVDSAVNDHIVGYSLPYKAWFYWDDIRANSLLQFTDDNSVKHLYFGASDEGRVYELYQGLTDNGAAYTARYRTKEFDLKEYNIEKLFQDWSLQFGGVFGEITVNTYVDGVLVDTCPFLSGASQRTADGLSTLPFATFPIGMEGNFTELTSTEGTLSNDWRWHQLGGIEGTTVQLEFVNGNINESFEIKQGKVAYIPLPYYKRAAEREV